MSRALPVALAAALAGALPGAYVALGGASYEPTPVGDPCAPRTWRAPAGIAEGLEQVALSAADGAACALGAGREELILALRDTDSLRAFARERGLSEDEVEEAVRAGVVRAVEDAEAAGAIGGTTAALLRGAAERLPIGFVLELVRSAADLLG